MKRLLVLLIAAMLLVACGNENDKEPEVNDETETEGYDNYEVLSEDEYEVELYDNDDMKIQLIKSRHERETGVQDFMKLMFNFENKTGKTLEFYFDRIKLDGNAYEITDISSSDIEIKPNETLDVIVVVDFFDEISFDEYIGGKLIYNDYDNNRSSIEFGEYIND